MFLDDTREQHVREEVRPAVERPDRLAELQGLASGRYAIATLAKAATADAPAETGSLSLQKKSENAITGLLEKCCGVQTMREEAHGQIEVQAFFASGTGPSISRHRQYVRSSPWSISRT